MLLLSPAADLPENADCWPVRGNAIRKRSRRSTSSLTVYRFIRWRVNVAWLKT